MPTSDSKIVPHSGKRAEGKLQCPSLTVGGAPVFLPTPIPLLPTELQSRLHPNPRKGKTAAHICSRAPPADMAPCTGQVRAFVGQVDDGLGRLSPKGVPVSLFPGDKMHCPLSSPGESILGLPGRVCASARDMYPEPQVPSPAKL